MPKKEIYDPKKGASTGHYSAGVAIDGWLYVSGHAAIDMDTGKVVPGTIEEQTLLTLKHIDRILRAGGCTTDDVVKSTVHLSDINDFDKFNAAYGTVFKGIRPARTTVQSGLEAGLKIEIDVVARIPTRAKSAAKRKNTGSRRRK